MIFGYRKKWKHFQRYMEHFKSSFPEYRTYDELHDFGHPDWTEGTWVFHECYKLAKGIKNDPMKRISRRTYQKIKTVLLDQNTVEGLNTIAATDLPPIRTGEEDNE